MIKFIRSLVEKHNAKKVVRLTYGFFDLVRKRNTITHFFFRRVALGIINRNAENPEIAKAWIESTQALVKHFTPVLKAQMEWLNANQCDPELKDFEKAFTDALNELLSEEKIPESQP